MSEPRVRFNRPARQEVVNIDYAAVLRQAVENERHRVLRELRTSIDRIDTTKPSSSYRKDDRPAKDFKREVFWAIDVAESQGYGSET